MNTLTDYILGYVLSLLITLFGAVLLGHHVFIAEHAYPSHTLLAVVFVGLALFQLVVQLVFFLHIGKGEKGRTNLPVLAFTLIIVCILVGGTLWIMANLDHNMNTMPEFTEDVPTAENHLH